MNFKINVGDQLPKFRAKDQDGNDFDSEDLLGAPAVIYFYPKDDTSTCTSQACAFRDHKEPFDKLDCRLIGISTDNAASHQAFRKKNNLNFTLLTDENFELAKKFGVMQEDAAKAQRVTFVVDENGRIIWIERSVNVEGHIDRIIEILSAQSR